MFLQIDGVVKIVVFGIWRQEPGAEHGGGWLQSTDGKVFQSPCKGVLQYYITMNELQDVEIAAFGDDGWPVHYAEFGGGENK